MTSKRNYLQVPMRQMTVLIEKQMEAIACHDSGLEQDARLKMVEANQISEEIVKGV